MVVGGAHSQMAEIVGRSMALVAGSACKRVTATSTIIEQRHRFNAALQRGREGDTAGKYIGHQWARVLACAQQPTSTTTVFVAALLLQKCRNRRRQCELRKGHTSLEPSRTSLNTSAKMSLMFAALTLLMIPLMDFLSACV